MRCASAKRMISDGLEGGLRPAKASRLKIHLAGCPDCRAFARDLESIVGEARRLPRHEPSAAAWQRIVSGVRTAGAEAPARTEPAVRWQSVLAAALALVVIGAGLFIRLHNRPRTDTGDRGAASFTLAKLKEAQGYYEKAIAALSEAVGSRETDLAPELAHVFERNLAGLDRTIQVCRQMVERSPDDPVIRAYLLSAYKEKVDLFEGLMGIARPPRDSMNPTTL